jgi:hypothetical protein
MPRAAYSLGSLLAVGHVVFCAIVISRQFEGSWGGFFIFLADFPASIAIAMIANVLSIHSIYFLVVLGTGWWFLLGVLISRLFVYVGARSKAARTLDRR